MKDNSQAATPADLRARRTRRVREKKAASKWLARRSDAPPSLESDAPPPLECESDAPPPAFEDESPSGITDKVQFESGAPHAIDAALPEAELAARLEATTVRPPSNPPPVEPKTDEAPLEALETKADVDDEKGETSEKNEKIEKVDTLEKVEKVEKLEALQKLDDVEVAPIVAPREASEDVIDERASGLPPKRQGGWLWMPIAVLVIAGGIFGVRTLMHRAHRVPKAPVVAVEAPPPPEPKASPTPAPSEPAPVATVTKTAVEAREEARLLLEKKKAAEALPLALFAVEQDPSDAQTWLVLGAAHQDLGHGVDARETFLQCTKKATAGPIHECRALLSYNGPR